MLDKNGVTVAVSIPHCTVQYPKSNFPSRILFPVGHGPRLRSITIDAFKTGSIIGAASDKKITDAASHCRRASVMLRPMVRSSIDAASVERVIDVASHCRKTSMMLRPTTGSIIDAASNKIKDAASHKRQASLMWHPLVGKILLELPVVCIRPNTTTSHRRTQTLRCILPLPKYQRSRSAPLIKYFLHSL